MASLFQLNKCYGHRGGVGRKCRGCSFATQNMTTGEKGAQNTFKVMITATDSGVEGHKKVSKTSWFESPNGNKRLLGSE